MMCGTNELEALLAGFDMSLTMEALLAGFDMFLTIEAQPRPMDPLEYRNIVEFFVNRQGHASNIV